MQLNQIILTLSILIGAFLLWPKAQTVGVPQTTKAIESIANIFVKSTSAPMHAPPPQEEVVKTDSLTDIQQKIEKLDHYLKDSGILAQIRAGRLPIEEQKSAAELIERLTDLRAREIELRLAAIQAELNGARQ